MSDFTPKYVQYAIYIRKSDTPCFLRILRSILGNGVYTVKYTYSTGTRQKRMSQRYPLSVGGERDEVKVIRGGGVIRHTAYVRVRRVIGAIYACVRWHVSQKWHTWDRVVS